MSTQMKKKFGDKLFGQREMYPVFCRINPENNNATIFKMSNMSTGQKGGGYVFTNCLWGQGWL